MLEKHVSIVCGSSGFIGQNLLSVLEGSAGLSLRSEGWQDHLFSASVIINLIGKAHDHKGTATKTDYYHTNLDLAKEIFKAFRASSTARLMIHVSSIAAVEEFVSDKPLTEEHNGFPSSWFGQSKRAAEEWLLSQQLPQDKKLIILRPPMVHGPREKGNLGLLYKLISKGIPYPLASFNNRRSFLSVDNFCYIINQVIQKRNLLKSGVYHIADDEYISTNEIIEIIKNVTGKNVLNLTLPKLIIWGIAKIGDFIPIPLNSKRLKKMTGNLTVCNQKIKKALGIEKLPLSAKEGLMKTITSFKDNHL